MIIAKLVEADRRNDLTIPSVIPLRSAPIAGDSVRLQDGRKLLVIRRTFIELPANPDEAADSIDLELTVREAKS